MYCICSEKQLQCKHEYSVEIKMKAATIQARIEPDLKERVDSILKKLGITSSQAVSALYAQIDLHDGLPFELKIPNRATQKARQELESGGGKSFKNFKAMLEDAE
jgi:DNA-damage-inducible protein J